HSISSEFAVQGAPPSGPRLIQASRLERPRPASRRARSAPHKSVTRRVRAATLKYITKPVTSTSVAANGAEDTDESKPRRCTSRGASPPRGSPGHDPNEGHAHRNRHQQPTGDRGESRMWTRSRWTRNG